MDAPADPRRGSPLRWVILLGILAFVLLITMVLLKFGQLKQTQDRNEARMDAIVSEMKPPAPARSAAPAGEMERLRRRVRELEEENRRLREADVPATPPAPEPAAPVAEPFPGIDDRLAKGLRELRGGRVAEAEAHFFRATPRSLPYLLITSLVRGDRAEALSFLARAARGDRYWYRRIRPREAFGSEEEYLAVLRALEERVRAEPLDAKAKTLLAFFYYHGKGPNYAKALLVEAAAADPDLAEARDFLESLD